MNSKRRAVLTQQKAVKPCKHKNPLPSLLPGWLLKLNLLRKAEKKRASGTHLGSFWMLSMEGERVAPSSMMAACRA